MMPGDAKKVIKASRASVISLALLGFSIVGIGIYNTWLIGKWGNIAGLTTILFAIAWSFFLYRFTCYPIIVFKDDEIEIISYPLSRTRKIALKDIKDVYRSWDLEAKVLLCDGKKIHLPISYMKDADYKFVISEIKKHVKRYSDS